MNENSQQCFAFVFMMQPPSSVGPHALPTIPSMVNVLCQTDVDCQECATQTDTKQPEDSAYQLHLARMEVARLQQFSQTQLANMNKQLIQVVNLLFVHICTHTHTSTHAHINTCTHTRTHAHTHTYTEYEVFCEL